MSGRRGRARGGRARSRTPADYGREVGLQMASELVRGYRQRNFPGASQESTDVPEWRRSEALDILARRMIHDLNDTNRGIACMSPNDRLQLFETNPLLAYHFPDLDPRNAMAPRRGTILPFDRSMLVLYLRVCLRLWGANWIHNFFDACPWLRARFPEFQPPGGWHDRLTQARRCPEHGNAPVQGPAWRREHYWPNRDPIRDPEPDNFVESRLYARRRSPARLRIVVSPARSPSPPRARRRSGSATPSPRIHGRAFRRSPRIVDDSVLVDTDLRLGCPGTRYAVPSQSGLAQYLDPTRFRRGDSPHGYISGAPPPPIYHDFDPRGRRIDDEGYRVERIRGPLFEPVDPSGEVDYNRPGTRTFPRRGPYSPVWDDNFTPAEARITEDVRTEMDEREDRTRNLGTW